MPIHELSPAAWRSACHDSIRALLTILQAAFTQDNHSRSVRGVLRGMHFQHPHGQVKLVRVVYGEVFDAVVDVVGAPQTGQGLP